VPPIGKIKMDEGGPFPVLNAS